MKILTSLSSMGQVGSEPFDLLIKMVLKLSIILTDENLLKMKLLNWPKIVLGLLPESSL